MPSQCPMTQRFQAGLECVEDLLLGQIGKLIAEAFDITKCVLVNDAHKAEEFEERVLQRSGGQQQLPAVCERRFQCVGDDVRWLIDVA